MAYRILLANADEVRAQLLPLWSANLPAQGVLEDKLRWFYRDGPHGEGHAFVIQPEHEHEALIGSAGLGVRTLWLRDQPLRCALFADVAIDHAQPEVHPAGFPELALLRAVKAHIRETFDLGYALPNLGAAGVYHRAGYRTLGVVTRYVRVLRTEAYVRRRIASGILARAVAAVLDRGLELGGRARALRDRSNLELVWLEHFDDRFDQLWLESRPLDTVVCERSAAFLRWRFSQQPGRSYQIAGLIEQVTCQVRAYAVVEAAHGVAELVDLFGTSADLDRLLLRLIPALHARGFRSIAFRFLGPSWMPMLLARHGFTRRAATRLVTLAVGAQRANRLELVDPGSWYLTDLDEDM